MKKKKVDVMREFDIWSDEFIKIGKDNGQYYFEIGKEITPDISEAVAILMRFKNKLSENVWDLEIDNIDYYNISPKRALYWLSGGDIEWKEMENYKKSWSECSLDFQEEFGLRVISIIKRSKTLRDIKNGFVKYLNLPILYEFALENDIV